MKPTLAPRTLLLLLALFLLGLSACDSDARDGDDDDSAVSDDDDAVDDDDSSTPNDDDAVDDDDSAQGDDDDSAQGDDDDSATSSLATLSGSVTRSVDPATGHDAVGNLFISVLGSQPSGGAPPSVIASMGSLGVDMSDPTTAVSYSVADIPPRAEPYFVIAFLDDDQSGPPLGAGDLRSSITPVTMDAAMAYTEDFILTTVHSP